MNYNKLKRTAEKITMPEGMEERLIKNCQEYAAQNNIDTDADFSQQVSGVETARPRHISRFVSTAAACAVIAGCVGTAAHFMKRSTSDTNNLAGEISETEVKFNPLADFNDHDYILSGAMGGIHTGLNMDQKSLFASYFSQCEYGEWTDDDELFAISRSFYEAYIFTSISETESIEITIDCNCCLTIRRYNRNVEAPNVGESNLIESTTCEKYKIDYNDFKNTVNLILSVEAIEKPTPFGDMHEFDFEFVSIYYNSHSCNIPITTEQRARIADFLNSIDYIEWTDEDEAEAAVSSYPAKERYRMSGGKSTGNVDGGNTDRTHLDFTFDVTGCFTVNYDQNQAKYKIDYNLFNETFQQIIGVNSNVFVDIGDEPFVAFEEYFQSGAGIKYTLSDEPMPDLTEEQCRLLDDYFMNVFNKIEEIGGHNANGSPVIIFEIKPTDLESYFIQIYSDDYILLRDDNTGADKWYKYSGDRMHAEIETVFRNGSTVDDAGFYPPFGNLAKSGGSYKIIRDLDTTYSITVDGDTLHQLFYGYDWAAYEIKDVADVPADSSEKFYFSFDYNDSYTNDVSIFSDGLIRWTIRNSLTNKIKEMHHYKLDDTKVWDELSKPFDELYGTSDSSGNE